MAAKKKDDVQEISFVEIRHATAEFCLLGRSPLIFNQMSAKAKRELLMPRGRMNAADKAANQKHDPLQEYVDSAYKHISDERPTRLYLPSTAFKGAILTAALDMPGAFKSQIGRLLWVNGYSIDVYGVPQMMMSVVRMADMKKTPDIRTRAILPEWACKISVSFMVPLIRDASVATLVAAGGVTSGVGDFRQEKGHGSFGQFTPVDHDDADWMRIVKEQGREAQDAALEDPQFFDPQTDELFAWYVDESRRRKTGGKPPKLEAVS